MATVTPVPIILGLFLALGAFSGLMWLLVLESRRPVHFPEPVSTRARVSPTRVAVIGVLFVVWSIWSTARPVSGWR